MENKHDSKRRLYLSILAPTAVIAVIAIASFLSGLSAARNVTVTSSTSSGFTTGTNGQTSTIGPTSGSSTFSTQPDPKSSPNTGIIVPIYASYSPSVLAEVNEIIQMKEKYPSVPIIAVINQDYGPGHTYDSNVSSEIQSLEAGHVTVLGYVATVYGTISLSYIYSEISNFSNWYHVQGIFLDQMPNWEYTGPDGQWNYNGPDGIYIPDYFGNVTAYIHSLGMNIVFANSGENVPLNLIGTVDSVGIFENSSMPAFFGPQSLTGPNGAYLNMSKNDFISFSYAQSSLDPYYVLAASDYVGWIYVTNETLPQPYDGLPPYFAELVSTIASSVSITVTSQLANTTHQEGENVSVSLTQPDGVTSEGFAPFTFNTLLGSTVTLTAGNVSGYTFSHWSDGNLNQIRNVTATQDTSLVAYYTTSSGISLP